MPATVVEEKELATYVTVDGNVRLEMLDCSIHEDFFSPAERERLSEEQIELLTKRYVNSDFFRSIECCLASVVKFGEELELDADNLLENAYKLDRPEHGLNFTEIIDETSPYSCIDIVLGEPSEEGQEKYGAVEIIPCDSEYRDELLYASILLTNILIKTGHFSINKGLFDENSQVDNGFAMDFSYVNFERNLKFFSANSKLKIETREVFEVE